MHLHKTQENKPQATKAASQKHSAPGEGLAIQQKADNSGLPAGLKAGTQHLIANTATAEAPLQPMRQETPGEPWHVMQQRQAPALSVAQQPIQRVADELQQPGITPKMKDRWDEAYPKMQGLVNASAFGQSPKHSILLWAASSGSLPLVKNAYGVTFLYMSNDDNYSGYVKDDYGEFSQIITPYNFSATPGRAYRIIIVVNLTRNASVEELYTTFLHEWYVHALPWMNDAQNGINVTDTNAAREKKEHKAYANKSDNDLDGYVNSLNLAAGVDKVTGKLQGDRDRYDTNTGDLK